MNIDTKGLALGDEVVDVISGFKGKVVGFTQWFSGCAVATIQPDWEKDKMPETAGFDVTRLVKVADATATSQRTAGGPQPTPPTTR